MHTCWVTAVLWNAFGMDLFFKFFIHRKSDLCFVVTLWNDFICVFILVSWTPVYGKRICNVSICFLRHDDVMWPDHMVLMKSYLVKFLFQTFARFWAIFMLKIDFLFFFSLLKSLHCKSFFQSLCIAKEFLNFHCIFDKVKWFVCFLLWIPVFWFHGKVTMTTALKRKLIKNSCFKTFRIIWVMMKTHWMKTQQHILPNFPIFCWGQPKNAKNFGIYFVFWINS